MTRKEALEDLLAKVEAGELESWREPVVAFGPPIDDRNFLAQVAYTGSLDAAKALHEAVLPGWDWDVFSRGGMGHAMLDFDLGDELKPIIVSECNEIPARAWLIAILRALIITGIERPDAVSGVPLANALPGIARGCNSTMRKDDMTNPIMKYFEYAHLPEHLQAVSKPFGDMAAHMNDQLPDGPEKSSGLRKLLEAKDCMVRAALG